MNDSAPCIQDKALLAAPGLDDPHFRQAVVFMVRHTDEESFGLIVNRPTEHSLENVLEQAAHARLNRQGWLHFGGPVDGPLVALHDQSDLADIPCSNGIYLTTDRAHLLDVLKRDYANVKLFAGFSGWGPNQLESELATGSWFVSDITSEQVLGDSDNLWKHLLYRVGHQMWSETGFDLGDRSRAGWN
jgi:putative transcriptional regulator